MTDFEKFKEKLLSKEKQLVKKINSKEYEHVPNAWNNFKMKMMKAYHGLY